MDTMVKLDENCFKYGALGENWKHMQSKNWFDPSFEAFVNKGIIPSDHGNNSKFLIKSSLICT